MMNSPSHFHINCSSLRSLPISRWQKLPPFRDVLGPTGVRHTAYGPAAQTPCQKPYNKQGLISAGPHITQVPTNVPSAMTQTSTSFCGRTALFIHAYVHVFTDITLRYKGHRLAASLINFILTFLQILETE